MTLELVTGPTAFPLSLIEAKEHLRVDDDNDDAYIEGLIATATAYLDGSSGILGRALIEQTWRWTLPAFPDRRPIPLPPLIEVVSVTYLDTAGIEQTLATSVYRVITGGTSGGWITLEVGQTWPSVLDADDAVRLDAKAGFGANWNDVPPTIRHVILVLVAHWYEHRAPVNIGNINSQLALMVDEMVAPYRMVRVA